MKKFGILNFTGLCSYGSNWQYVNIGPGNGLAPNKPLSEQMLT